MLQTSLLNERKKFSEPTCAPCAPARSAPASVAGSLGSDRLLNRFCACTVWLITAAHNKAPQKSQLNTTEANSEFLYFKCFPSLSFFLRNFPLILALTVSISKTIAPVTKPSLYRKTVDLWCSITYWSKRLERWNAKSCTNSAVRFRHVHDLLLLDISLHTRRPAHACYRDREALLY
jgi:hypothetical protein